MDAGQVFVSAQEMTASARSDSLHAQQMSAAGDCEGCTAAQGYLLQPVYVCKTCPGQPAGMCLGCSLNCHLVSTLG